MTDEIIVAVFDEASNADAALAELRAARVPEHAIGLHRGGRAVPREQGFWASLFGTGPENGTELYEQSLQRGSTVLTVRTPSERVDRVLQLLERHHPVDMQDHPADYDPAPSAGLEPAQAPVSSPATAQPDPVPDAADADDAMPLAEESLQVSKRVVTRGGTRIRRYVVETPVEQSVTLRDERVTLDRHPVAEDRAAGGDAFTDMVVEMTETAEEAVVSKTARVVEEVSLRKQAQERVETVRDTVRRQEVAVEQLPGTAINADDLPPRPRAPRP